MDMYVYVKGYMKYVLIVHNVQPIGRSLLGGQIFHTIFYKIESSRKKNIVGSEMDMIISLSTSAISYSIAH